MRHESATQEDVLRYVLERLEAIGRSKADIARAAAQRCGCSPETVLRFLRNEHACAANVMLAVMAEVGIHLVMPTPPPSAHDQARKIDLESVSV